MLRYFIWLCCFRVVLAEEWNCSTTSGKYTLSSDCVVSSQVEVTGILSLTGVVNASGVLPRVVGGGFNRLFYVGSGGNLTIRSLNLTGGNATDNHQPDNHADNHAGALYVDSGIFTAFDSSIYGNEALYTSALYATGGAVVRLEGTVVGFNRALSNSGGIYITGSATSFEMVGGMIENNVGSASSMGGITCMEGSQCTIISVTIRRNIAGAAAGIYIHGAFLNLKDSIVEFNGNEFTNSGAGVACYGSYDTTATCNISNVIIRYNKALSAHNAPWYGGGGLRAQGNAYVSIYESSFIFNDAENQGDEIKTEPWNGIKPTVTMVNVHFANRQCPSFGGVQCISYEWSVEM